MTEKLPGGDPSGESLKSQFTDYARVLSDVEDRSAEKLSQRSKDALTVSLSDLAERVPEIDRDYDAIDARGQQLIERFAIKPELFDDPGRSLLFAAIAARLAKEGAESDPAEQQLAESWLTLLAFDHSDTLKQAKTETDPPFTKLTREQQLGVYKLYTDEQLTNAFKASYDAAVLGDLKSRLGVADDERPYEVVVLSIGDSSHTMGLEAAAFNIDEELTSEETAEREQEEKDVERWKRGLDARTEEFKKYMGLSGIGWAWVDNLGEASPPIMYVMSPVAEKLLDPTLTQNADIEFDAAAEAETDRALLWHEYVHTQGGLRLGDLFGNNLEELRAEAYSGDFGGYLDIKNFFMDYQTATGHDVKQEILDTAKGGTPEEIYTSIANKVGLDMMLEVVSALPRHYIRSNLVNSNATRVFRSLGQYDGIISRLIEKFKDAGGFDERVDERARQDMAGQPPLKGLRVEGRHYYGANAMTYVVLERVGELRDEEMKELALKT